MSRTKFGLDCRYASPNWLSIQMSIPRRRRVTVDIFLQMLPVCLNCHFESPRSAPAANRFQTQAGVSAY